MNAKLQSGVGKYSHIKCWIMIERNYNFYVCFYRIRFLTTSFTYRCKFITCNERRATKQTHRCVFFWFGDLQIGSSYKLANTFTRMKKKENVSLEGKWSIAYFWVVPRSISFTVFCCLWYGFQTNSLMLWTFLCNNKRKRIARENIIQKGTQTVYDNWKIVSKKMLRILY